MYLYSPVNYIACLLLPTCPHCREIAIGHTLHVLLKLYLEVVITIENLVQFTLMVI